MKWNFFKKVHDRKQYDYKNIVDGNCIRIIDNGKSEDFDLAYPVAGMKIRVSGQNNKIILHKPYKFVGNAIVINGDNNNIELFGTNLSISNTYFCMEPRAHHRSIVIGKNSYIGQAKLMCFGSDDKLHIGEECLLSSGIHIRTGDSHAIIDHTTKKLLNKHGSVFIGNHCWFGVDSFVSKKVTIPNNTIIAAKAAVVCSFDQSYTILGGGACESC
jgi:acetyltransferase-like isoleucine patch superfamily enzyme